MFLAVSSKFCQQTNKQTKQKGEDRQKEPENTVMAISRTHKGMARFGLVRLEKEANGLEAEIRKTGNRL